MKTRHIILAFGLTVVAAYSVFSISFEKKNMTLVESSHELTDVVLSPTKLIHWDNLIDHNSRPINRERINKFWTFVFFGYTQCPDVCPATLSQLARFNQQLKQQASLSDKTQIFFVSVDPARDTPKLLADFVSYFDPSFSAISGSTEAIKGIEDQFGTYHQFERETAPGEYAVTHSAYIYLINPKGQLTAKFTPPMNIDEVFTQLSLFVELFSKDKDLT